MRSFLAVILTLLFVWNSLLGAMGELVLCLHANGDTHLELAGKKAPEKEHCCEHTETEILIAPDACPPCTDLILESVDLESIRPNGFESAPPAMAVLPSDSHFLTERALRPGTDVAVSHPTRGPPDAEPASELIRRVVILRL
ncbi:MAG: hypothetical protein ACPGSB_03810 [Opitutales bacterium]